MTACLTCLLLAASAAPPPPPSEAAQAEFLRQAGIIASRRASMQLGAVRHDAHVQAINNPSGTGLLACHGFYDGLRALDNIPVTVLRDFNGRPASFTWWIDDTLMTEKTRQAKAIQPPDTQAWNRQVYAMKVFDLLIHNVDRNMGNVIIDKRWKLWMIDHSRAFQPEPVLHDRALLARLRTLDAANLQPKLGPWIAPAQISALLTRRDLIVKAFEELIAAKGEEEVLYDHLPAGK